MLQGRWRICIRCARQSEAIQQAATCSLAKVMQVPADMAHGGGEVVVSKGRRLSLPVDLVAEWHQERVE